MAHSSTFYTLAVVAKRLGEDEAWLYEISCGMEDAEGCIGVIDADQNYVVAFDEVGIENSSASSPITSPTHDKGAATSTANHCACGSRRMLTFQPQSEG